MSFATSLATFSARASKSLRSLSPATIQPYAGVTPDLPAGAASGCKVKAFLSAVRVERELADNAVGFVITNKAQLRVLKTAAWTPAEGAEFVHIETGDRFRCNSAAGAASAYAAEIVCEVTRIDR